MRGLFYVFSALAVMGLAVWAYRENFETKQAIHASEQLQRQIGRARAELAMLRAEWAYLNRPDRLRELADLNFGTLRLMTLRAEQFGRIDQVAYPAVGLPQISHPVDVIGTLETRP